MHENFLLSTFHTDNVSNVLKIQDNERENDET